MKYSLSICIIVTIVMLPRLSDAEPLDVLIIDGQNNHGVWPKTTMMMKQYLENCGRFKVDISRTRYTWSGGDYVDQFPLEDGKTYEHLDAPKSDPEFKPSFSNYDVIVSNFGYNAAPWPKDTQESFTEYIADGGGLVIVHAANNSFGDWNEYNKIIGLGGWSGRNEKTGPYVYIDAKGQTVRDGSPGSGGSHGPQHSFQIVVRNDNHPITRGLPRSWMHAQDELYQMLRGPAANMAILATAYADKKQAGTGRHEPMMMTIDYGHGRVYHTPMGHADYSMECVGFITTFVRGAEWAATGNVTLTDIPDDFPGRNKTRQRKFQP